MTMHVSRIFNEYPDANGCRHQLFSLTAEASEWLFSIGFWNKINDRFGTNFDQYEEDCASCAVVFGISEALRSLIQCLTDMHDLELVFRYGLAEDGSVLKAVIGRDKLRLELKEFEKCLNNALNNGVNLEFSL